MGKKGVSMISGVINPTVGQVNTYNIVSWYPDTSAAERNPKNVTWELFKMRSNGKFTSTQIKKKGVSSFTFGEAAIGSTYKLQGYLHQPEGGGLIINPKASIVPKIEKVELFYVDDTPGKKFSFLEKLRVRAYCTNMLNKVLVFTLWEDDNLKEGHNEKNKLIATKKGRVPNDGVAVAEFELSEALMKKALEGEINVKQLEFYVTAHYYPKKKHESGNIYINNPFPEDKSVKATPSTTNAGQVNAKSSQSSQQPNPKSSQQSQPVEPVQVKGTATLSKPPTPAASSGITPIQINPNHVEGLTDAYFAKKVYTQPTDEVAGFYTYKIKNNTKEKAKQKIAEEIVKIANASLLKEKRYAKQETIIAALSGETPFAGGKEIRFETYRLGPKFEKISSAPLEDKVYLVARGYVLEGKEATITIKEKDGLIKGSKDAVLPILEITEQQMEETSPSKEVQGTEKSEFKGTIKDGLVKIPVHLRPKSDEDLKKWKEKLAKGEKKTAYTPSKFGGINNITDEKKSKLPQSSCKI